jgi:hypothetical protein
MHYRRIGGQVELELFDGEAEGLIAGLPTSPATGQAMEKIIEFVHKRIW